MVDMFLGEMTRVPDHLYYLAVVIAFMGAFALSYVADTGRAVLAFCFFFILSLAAVVIIKLAGISITGNRITDAIFAMAAAMSSAIIAVTAIIVAFHSILRPRKLAEKSPALR